MSLIRTEWPVARQKEVRQDFWAKREKEEMNLGEKETLREQRGNRGCKIGERQKAMRPKVD